MKETGEGKVFSENEGVIKRGLVKIGLDERLLEDCKGWTGEKVFPLNKENPLVLPCSITKLFLGLGWKTKCDIDCSVITFSAAN